MTAAFTSEECDVLQQALDSAWEIFLRGDQPGRYDAEAVNGALTRAILDEYEHGERNMRRMAIAAVAYIDQFDLGPDSEPAAKPAL